jgi:hypothetical protein
VALNDRASRCQRLAFELLALLEGRDVVGSVLGSLKFSQGAGSSTALEVLSNLGDREAAGLLVLLTEPSPLEERLATAKRESHFLSGLPSAREEILTESLQSPGRFVSRAALEALGLRPPSSHLVRLHRLELFSELSLEALEKMNDLLIEERFAEGEEILTRGKPGNKLYLVWRGKSNTEEAILGEVGALDEGPVLDTVRAKRPTQVYSISHENLQGLIRQHPSVAFPLINRLTAALRSRDRAVTT